MFMLRRPTEVQVARRVEEARRSRPRIAVLMSIDGQGPDVDVRVGFAHDRTESRLGEGTDIFDKAKRAFAEWVHFDLGWVRVANPDARIAVGAIVAVEVRSLGLWSLNLSRIVETVDTKERFGFVYSTTEMHLEQGEERFLVRFDAASGGVWYELEALSKPWSLLATMGYPVTRAFQHRFARDSHRRMAEAVRNA